MNDSTHIFVRPDSYLTLHYRIELVSGPAAGSVFADTFDQRPATLQLGTGQWAPGLEQVLVGHHEGERFTIDIPAALAYGDRNPDLLQWVTRAAVEKNTNPETPLLAGDLIEFAAPNGARYSGVLKQWEGDRALFDFNHPLAGTDLRLHVELLGVL